MRADYARSATMSDEGVRIAVEALIALGASFEAVPVPFGWTIWTKDERHPVLVIEATAAEHPLVEELPDEPDPDDQREREREARALERRDD